MNLLLSTLTSALTVHSGRVKVIHGNIRFWTDGMCHWPRIFVELASAQSTDILDAFDGIGTHISGKFLISKYGQTFLES
jgi:hypothetical protein